MRLLLTPRADGRPAAAGQYGGPVEQTASRPDVDHGPVDALVDWDLAVQAAGHLVRPGPQVGADEARQVVEQLRGFARDSTGYVAETTGLVATPGEDVLVVDRTGWVTANVDAFRELLAPAVAAAQSKRDRPPGPVVQAVGRKVTGVELGSLLSFLASKVLGQYDIADPSGGRLLLVAPNIVQVERELDAEPADFRLWVCLHEETHRVQFTANPWLRAHLLESSRAMVTDLLGDPASSPTASPPPPATCPTCCAAGTAPACSSWCSPRSSGGRWPGVTAVMSLLEGHADVVMDEVGPQVIPTVGTIRERFTARRAGSGGLDRMLRRLLGLDAKMRQYRDGAGFVRGVTAAVGTEGFNAVWTSPDTLPLPEEITDPAAWVRRVHG